MRRVPYPTPRAPRRDRLSGVVPARPVQDLCEWGIFALAAFFERAGEVEKIARDTLQTAPGLSSGVGGKSPYADDGTMPGPTPRVALRTDYEANALVMYEAALADLRLAILRIEQASSKFMVMDPALVKEQIERERGGAYCRVCLEWVAQEGNDWLRRGLCDRCRKREERAAVEA